MSNRSVLSYFKNRIHPKYLKLIKPRSDRLSSWFIEQESTALFVRIRNWIDFPKHYEPSELVSFHYDYVSMVVDTVIANEGTFDQFNGDEVVAIFGAPIEQTRHAHNACECLLQVRSEFARLLSRLEKVKEILTIEAGMNSGPFSCGFLGPKNFPRYTMMGDQVNIAARCLSASNQFGTWNLVGNRSVELCQAEYGFRRIGEFKIPTHPGTMDFHELTHRKSEG